MDNAKHTYEAMFVLEAGQSDFEAAGEPIRNILTRYDAEVLALKPWDERKLAYPIRGRKRGLYAIAYFKVDPSHVAEIEHDAQLEEHILRALILQKPKLTEEEIAADTPATTSRRAAEERSARRAKKDKSEGGGEGAPAAKEKVEQKGEPDEKQEKPKEQPAPKKPDEPNEEEGDSSDSGDGGEGDGGDGKDSGAESEAAKE